MTSGWRVFVREKNILLKRLNIAKTVAIPLWDEPLPDIKQALGIAIPAWRDIAVQSKGTYLGFAVGPSSQETRGIKP